MNKMKKFASIATAVLMTACMAAPMTMSLTSSAATTYSFNADFTLNGEEKTAITTAMNNADATDAEIAEYIYTNWDSLSADTTTYPSLDGKSKDEVVTAIEETPDTPVAVAKEAFKIKFDGETGVTHKYTAYQIFTGTMMDNDSSAKKEIAGIAWAEGVNSEAFLTALKGEANPFKDKFTDCTTAAAVAKVIQNEIQTTDNVKRFAKFLESQVANLKKVNETSSETITLADDVKDSEGKITSTPGDGWYLIVDDTTQTLSDSGAFSSYLLSSVNASDGIVVKVKSDAPSVVKKVQENVKTVTGKDTVKGGYWEADDKYNDVADYCIGDKVPFRLEATLPATNFVDYEKYYVEFTDHLDKGFKEPTEFTVNVGGMKTLTFTKNEGSWTNDDNDSNVTVEVTSDDNGLDISVSIFDVKNYDVEADADNGIKENKIAAGAKITVDYEAELDVDAVIGRPGNYNDVYLKYSNNPKDFGDGNNDGKPDKPGETPKDGVVVFTYEFDVHKFDGKGDHTEVLPGAKFYLQNSEGEYLKITESEGTVTKHEWISATPNASTGVVEGATTFESAAGGDITISGLDDGEYTLVEYQAPQGYNKVAPITFKIDATTVNDQAQDKIGPASVAERTGEEQLTAIKLSHEVAAGDTDDEAWESEADFVNGKNAVIDVENNSGAELPGTGGIGTKLFYVGGGAMVAVAGVFLITKKRMSKKEN